MKIGSRPVDRLYADAIKPIRNRMRQYNHASLLDSFLQYLNAPPLADKVKDLQRLPWVAERLVIWLLSDNPRLYGQNNATTSEVSKFVGLAWEELNGLFKKREISSVKLFVRQLFISQMPYQVGLDSHAFALQIYLVTRLNTNSKLRIFLNQKAGMPIDKFFELALFFWSHSNQEKPWFNRHYFSPLLPLFSEREILIFLSSMSVTKDHLHKTLSNRTLELDEWFQPTPLYKTPCVIHENVVIPFGRPTLRRYFESLIGDWLEEEDTQLLQHYDRLVSDYVEFAIKRSKSTYLSETEIKSQVGNGVKVCDFLIEEPNGYVLLEVKNKSLTRTLPASSAPQSILSKLKGTVLKGKKQLDDTRAACSQQPQYKNLTCYRVIVTNSDLWLGDITSIIEDYDDPLPIWFLSLEEIDHLAEIVSSGKETFCGFFETVVARNKQPQLSVFSAGWLLHEHPHKQTKLPEHLLAEADRVFESLASKIQNSQQN